MARIVVDHSLGLEHMLKQEVAGLQATVASLDSRLQQLVILLLGGCAGQYGPDCG